MDFRSAQPAPHQRNYCYADPQTAYDELFKSVTNPGAVDSDNAMSKFLQGEESFKALVLQGHEKLKLSNHISSIESRNQKVAKMSDAIARYLPRLDKIHVSGGPDASTPEKQQAMTEILIAALTTGLANVVTYTIDELSTPIKGLPGNEEGHKTIGNWYTTLLNAHGNPVKHYGDLDLAMSRKKSDQAGAIKQLMG